VLPAPPAQDAGPPPPNRPRQLPPGFARRTRYWNPSFVFGVVLFAIAVVFGTLLTGDDILHGSTPIRGPVWFLFFAGCGFAKLWNTHRKAMIVLRAFEHGIATQGEIIAVYRNESVKFNNRSPWVVEYTFQYRHQDYECRVQTWDAAARLRDAGEPVYVLYMEENPWQNTIYPPFE
jgi:hypothetical protein